MEYRDGIGKGKKPRRSRKTHRTIFEDCDRFLAPGEVALIWRRRGFLIVRRSTLEDKPELTPLQLDLVRKYRKSYLAKVTG